MSYKRVIPRDFFNESKLLKCMGLLAVKILDQTTPCKIEIDEPGQPFEIELLQEGSLFVRNYRVYVKGVPVTMKTTYNSKENFPFFCEYKLTDYRVFTDDGVWDEEFLEFIKSLD